MAFNDDGPDDWVSLPSAPSTPAPSGLRAATAGPADDWVAVAPRPIAAPVVRPTAPMPPVQAVDDWTPVATSNSNSTPNGEQNESGPAASAGRYALEFGKSVVEGVKGMGSTGLKGAGAVIATAGPEQVRRQLAVMDRIDRGEPVPDGDDPLGYQYFGPKERAEARAAYQSYQPTKVVEHPLYRAGQALEDFGESALGPAKGWESSWTRDIGSGLGSVAAGIGLAAIPGVGPAVAGATFLTGGQGEAADRAIKAGATEQQIGQAARYGTIAGATDVVDALLPALGSTGRVLGFIRRVGYAAVVDALAEGGQEGVQQIIQNMIAQGIYKPDQDLMEDVPRNAAVGAIVGGAVGGGHAVMHGDHEQHAAAPANSFQLDKATNTAESVLSQPPQPPPSALAAGYSTAQSVLNGTEPPPPPAGAPPPAAAPISAPAAMPAGLSPVEQRLLLAQGLTPAQIAAMSRQQIDATIEQAGEAAAAPAPATATAPLEATPAPEAVSRETPAAVATDVLNASPTPPQPNRFTLQAMLDDPRSVDEMRADADRARNWAPTPEWQQVPAGAQLDPSLEVRTTDGVQEARLAPTPGTKAAPVELLTPEDVHAGAEQTATPTPAQAEAGNYRKRHVDWNGLSISIETEQGQERTGIGADGKPWSVAMPAPYGYVKGTEGADGDHVDVYIGPNPASPKVFAFDQIDPDSGKFDEHKFVLGTESQAQARSIYEAAFSDGSGYLRGGAVTELTVPQFKAWLKDGNASNPLAYEPKAAIEVKPRAPRNRAPYSLLEFIASKGGLAPHPELRAIFDRANPLIPGMGRLIRTGGGQTLDRAREAAVEAGYLRDTPYEGGMSTSTIRDLLDAIEGEHRGNKLYSEHDLAEIADRQGQKAVKEDVRRRKQIGSDLRALAGSVEITNLTDAEIEHATALVMEEGYELEEALVDAAERSAMAADEEVVQLQEEAARGDAPASENEVSAEAAGGGQQQAARPVARQEGQPAPRREQPREAQQPQEPERAESAEPTQPAVGAERTSSTERTQPVASSEPANPTSETAPSVKPWSDEIEAKRQAYFATDTFKHSKAMETAIDKIEHAIEANDRPGVQDAARAARKVLAEIPQSEKDSDPEFWKQFPGQITRMTKPGYVTAKQEVEAEQAAKSAKTEEGISSSLQEREQIAPQPAEKPAEPASPASEKASSESASNPGEKINTSPDVTLAHALLDRLSSGKPITAKILQEEASAAHGGKLNEGKFDRKDAHDALELAVNLYIKETRHLRVDSPNPQHAIKMLTDVLDSLPAQRVRSDEQVRFQQFSTPPNYAAAVAYVANLRNGDTMLEPSAGTGSIVAAASAPGVKIVANELSERRLAMLRDLIGKDGEVFHEDAEQLDNILPDTVKPTVVVMNPPFSQTAGRMGDRKDQAVAQRHIEQALNRLEDGGRLVAIVGQGMTLGSPTHRAFWDRIGKANAIRASIGVEGKVYEKYGTTFGTRVYVIDKVAPDGSKPVTTNVASIDELMKALEPVRNVRPETEQRPDQSSSTGAAEGNPRARTAAVSAPADASRVGAGERSGRDGELAGSRPAGAAEPGGHASSVEAGQRDVLAGEQSERAGPGRAGSELASNAAVGGDAATSGNASAGSNLQPASSGQSGAAASSERVEVEAAAPGKQTKSELTESLYEHYEPRRARVKGAKPHPGPLVESASMASVLPPEASYKPHFPKGVVEDGLLSTAQLEPVIYAGQAHEKMLPAAEGEAPRRRGFFIGDGTGVGKGREIAGIILDNWSQGRTKAIWVSEKQTLLQDAKRDWSGLKQDANHIFNAGKVKAGEPIESGKGIGFITYDTLKGGMSDQAAIAKGGFIRKQEVTVDGAAGIVQRVIPGRRNQPGQVVVKMRDGSTVTVPAGEVQATGALQVKSRVDQLVDWFGKDFDGVIAFDEAHNMGNAATSKGERGDKDASQKALAGLELQRRMPNARVVYVSATGATEVSNLAYADRLGLWGRGTPFASREKFITDVEGGGIAAMELIARDMKQLGLYTARNLSYDGVEYNRIEHKLDANQREIYDTLAEAWQVVLKNINEAIKITGAKSDARAKSAAMSAFWGGHQRFFNQVVTSLQMPSVISAVEKDIKAGRQAVLQLTNTNEASQERAAAKAQTAEDIEDLDITPRDQIIQLVENSFPTQQYEEYEDEDGKVRSRPVVDSDGNPVENKQAVRMREALIDRLASIRVPQGPLDMVLDHFGVENVAEVTGRGRRFVLKPDEKTGERRRVEESRPGSSNLGETDAFQSGKKKILVFSEAGGTGRSYHADNSSSSKDNRRAHYLVQGGWRADKAVQGFGRTHRTNQATAPIVSLVTTDLQGQKRFISSIARRLSQLGALTKGQRQAGDQGIFSARDNLESTEAAYALRQFYSDLYRGQIEGISLKDFEEQTGLSLAKKDEEGRSQGMREDTPPITTFLNRLLSLKINLQNAVFDAFSERLDAVIEARAQAGLLDAGLETVKADKIEKDSDRVVHTAAESGAETRYVKVKLSDKFDAVDFDKIAKNVVRPVAKWVKSPKGKVYAVAQAPNLTNGDGRIVDQYRIINPVSGGRIVSQNTIDAKRAAGGEWTTISKTEAQSLWQKEIEAAPEYVTRDMHLITGAILPIWDRLQGSTRVVRLQTDDGERLLGRVVPRSSLSQTLKNLGAEGEASKVTPASLYKELIGGGRAKLANGWTLSRRLVAGEQRIELKGPASHSEGQEVERDGAFAERINYEKRYFVPASESEGTKVLERLTQYRPVVEIGEGQRQALELEGDEEFSLRQAPKGWDSVDTTSDDNNEPTSISGYSLRIFNDKFKDPAIAGAIRTAMDRAGLHDIGLRLIDRMEIWNGEERTGSALGSFRAAEDLITIALDGQSAELIAKTLHHEMLHAMRSLGLFTDAEWKILTRASENQWRGQYNIDGFYRWALPEKRNEEGIAHAYGDWIANRGKPITDGRIVRIFKKIKAFFDALGNALRGQGFKTADDVFESVRSGEVGGRERNPARDRETDFSAEEGADGKPQLVIPGAERMSDRELARRKALASKQATKPQKGTEGLPLFGDAKNQGELFSAVPPRSEAQKTVLERIAPSEKREREMTFNRLYTAAKDDLNPIRVLRDQLAGGRELEAREDPYKLARLTRGSYGKAQQFLENGTFAFDSLETTGKGLKEILKPVRNDLDGLRAYAVAKRTLELNERGIRTGVPIEEAERTVTEGGETYEGVFRDLVTYQRSLTQYLHASGILSDEGYAAMLSANRDYVPFFRLMGEGSELGSGLGGGLKVRDPVRGIRGSDRKIIDPIESIIKNTFLFVSLAERNRSLVALADLADSSEHGDQLFPKAQRSVRPINVSAEEIGRFLTAQGVDHDAANAMTIFRPQTFRPSENEIALFRDGKREIRTVTPEVGEAVNALDRASIGLVTKILSIPARTLRAGAVLSPEFIARNPVRDQFEAFVNSEHGYIPFVDMVRGMGSILKPGGGRAYQMWLKSGASGAAMVSIDRDYINDKIMKLEQPSLLKRAKHVLSSPLEALRVLSELMENATRIGEFMRATGKGKSPFAAGFSSREVTLDFARMGAQARALNAIISFWNANVEGTDRMVRQFRKKPLASTFKAAVSITLPSVLLWFLNHDDDRYKELPQWQKDLFWIIPTDKWVPHQVKGADGKLRDATDLDMGNKAKRTYFRKVGDKWMVNEGTIWRIPKPFTLGVLFGSIPERMLDAFYDHKPHAFQQIGKTLEGALLPNVIPQAALPMLEQATNHSFFLERPLVPKYLEEVRAKYQATNYTSETAKKIGALISKVNDDTSLGSPLVIDNYIRQWTGSLGASLVQTIDSGLKAAGLAETKIQPSKSMADMPMVRAFVSRFPSSGMESIEDFYTEYNHRKTNVGTVKFLSKGGEGAAAKEEAENYPLQTAEKIHKALGVQSKVIRGIYLDKTMPADDKRKLIDNVYLEMIELARAGNDVLLKSEKQAP